MSARTNAQEQPPLNLPSSRVWAPLAAGAGALLAVGAGGVTLTRLQASVQPEPEPVRMVAAPPVEMVVNPVVPAVAPVTKVPFLNGAGPLAPSASLSTSVTLPVPTPGAITPAPGGTTGRRGAIGYMGPINGPLSTQVASGPVVGPIWNRSPLPVPGGPVGLPAPSPTLPGPSVAPATGSALGSELPDAQRIALSRLANPGQSSPTGAGVKPVADKSATVSAERPLSVRMAVGKPKRGYLAGETVAVRLNATADCYMAIIRVDAAGKAATVFSSPVLARQAACAIRLGPASGAEYLLALASVRPLSGSEAASALKGLGGFNIVPAAAGEGASPAAAWNLAVSQAGGLGGGSANWERYEWAVSTTAFAVRPAPAVATVPGAGKAEPVKPVKPETAATSGAKPAAGPGDASLLPGAGNGKPAEAVKPEAKPEKVEPKVEKSEMKPPTEMRPAEKPAEKPAGAPAPEGSAG